MGLGDVTGEERGKKPEICKMNFKSGQRRRTGTRLTFS